MSKIYKKESSLLYLLEQVGKRPGMFIGGKHLYLLIGFIDGIKTGPLLLGMGTVGQEGESSILSDFFQYIYGKLQYIQNKYPPSNPLRQYIQHELLLLASDNDPEKAFDLFFELFDEFRKEKGIVFEWDDPLPWEEDGEKQYFLGK